MHKVYHITEPMLEGKYWAELYLKGIKREAARLKLDAVRFDAPDGVSCEGCAVIINGVSKDWTAAAVGAVLQKDCVPLALTPVNLRGCSTIALDFYNVYKDMLALFKKEGAPRAALIGALKTSFNDDVKILAVSDYYGGCADGHIFYNDAGLAQTFEAFFERLGDYDAAAFVNDVVAFNFMRFLKNKSGQNGVRLRFGTLASTALAEFFPKSVITEKFDCFQIGAEAVKLAAFLQKSGNLCEVAALVRDKKRIGGDNIAGGGCGAQNAFYGDTAVESVFRLEKLLSACDSADIGILKGISEGKNYVRIGLENYLSEAAVKYRVRRLRGIFGTASPRELARSVLSVLSAPRDEN
ncbi:MAG: hypothetical protein LBP26_04360 [Clostridiales bacterium]|jgi:hypothetical protein|nr:hypothetical protein [Clostridiales bacterium]